MSLIFVFALFFNSIFNTFQYDPNGCGTGFVANKCGIKPCVQMKYDDYSSNFQYSVNSTTICKSSMYVLKASGYTPLSTVFQNMTGSILPRTIRPIAFNSDFCSPGTDCTIAYSFQTKAMATTDFTSSTVTAAVAGMTNVIYAEKDVFAPGHFIYRSQPATKLTFDSNKACFNLPTGVDAILISGTIHLRLTFSGTDFRYNGLSAFLQPDDISTGSNKFKFGASRGYQANVSRIATNAQFMLRTIQIPITLNGDQYFDKTNPTLTEFKVNHNVDYLNGTVAPPPAFYVGRRNPRVNYTYPLFCSSLSEQTIREKIVPLYPSFCSINTPADDSDPDCVVQSFYISQTNYMDITYNLRSNPTTEYPSANAIVLYNSPECPNKFYYSYTFKSFTYLQTPSITDTYSSARGVYTPYNLPLRAHQFLNRFKAFPAYTIWYHVSTMLYQQALLCPYIGGYGSYCPKQLGICFTNAYEAYYHDVFYTNAKFYLQRSVPYRSSPLQLPGNYQCTSDLLSTEGYSVHSLDSCGNPTYKERVINIILASYVASNKSSSIHYLFNNNTITNTILSYDIGDKLVSGIDKLGTESYEPFVSYLLFLHRYLDLDPYFNYFKFISTFCVNSDYHSNTVYLIFCQIAIGNLHSLHMSMADSDTLTPYEFYTPLFESFIYNSDGVTAYGRDVVLATYGVSFKTLQTFGITTGLVCSFLPRNETIAYGSGQCIRNFINVTVFCPDSYASILSIHTVDDSLLVQYDRPVSNSFSLGPNTYYTRHQRDTYYECFSSLGVYSNIVQDFMPLSRVSAVHQSRAVGVDNLSSTDISTVIASELPPTLLLTSTGVNYYEFPSTNINPFKPVVLLYSDKNVQLNFQLDSALCVGLPTIIKKAASITPTEYTNYINLPSGSFLIITDEPVIEDALFMGLTMQVPNVCTKVVPDIIYDCPSIVCDGSCTPQQTTYCNSLKSSLNILKDLISSYNGIVQQVADIYSQYGAINGSNSFDGFFSTPYITSNSSSFSSAPTTPTPVVTTARNLLRRRRRSLSSDIEAANLPPEWYSNCSDINLKDLDVVAMATANTFIFGQTIFGRKASLSINDLNHATKCIADKVNALGSIVEVQGANIVALNNFTISLAKFVTDSVNKINSGITNVTTAFNIFSNQTTAAFSAVSVALQDINSRLNVLQQDFSVFSIYTNYVTSATSYMLDIKITASSVLSSFTQCFSTLVSGVLSPSCVPTTMLTAYLAKLTNLPKGCRFSIKPEHTYLYHKHPLVVGYVATSSGPLITLLVPMVCSTNEPYVYNLKAPLIKVDGTVYDAPPRRVFYSKVTGRCTDPLTLISDDCTFSSYFPVAYKRKTFYSSTDSGSLCTVVHDVDTNSVTSTCSQIPSFDVPYNPLPEYFNNFFNYTAAYINSSIYNIPIPSIGPVTYDSVNTSVFENLTNYYSGLFESYQSNLTSLWEYYHSLGNLNVTITPPSTNVAKFFSDVFGWFENTIGSIANWFADLVKTPFVMAAIIVGSIAGGILLICVLYFICKASHRGRFKSD